MMEVKILIGITLIMLCQQIKFNDSSSVSICDADITRVSCPADHQLIMQKVTVPAGTQCDNFQGCPNPEDLLDILVNRCSLKPSCTLPDNSTICHPFIGHLFVEAICIKDTSMITPCSVSTSYTLDDTTSPLILLSPGYPGQYTIDEKCETSVTIPTNTLSSLTLLDNPENVLGVYVCIWDEMSVEVHLLESELPCEELSLGETIPHTTVTTYKFKFYPHSNSKRGFTLQIYKGDNPGNTTPDVSILYLNNTNDNSNNDENGEFSFLVFNTPLVAGMIAGTVVIFIIMLTVCAVLCRKKKKQNKQSQQDLERPEKKNQNVSATKKSTKETKKSLENDRKKNPFFAGARTDPNSTSKTSVVNPRKPSGGTGSPTYANASEFRDEILSHTTLPPKKKHLKTPRRGKKPRVPMNPIYENTSFEEEPS